MLVVSVAMVAGLLVVVTVAPRSSFAQVCGDLTGLVAALLATGACLRAAHRHGPERRGWRMMALAVGVWATAELTWTIYGLTRDHVYPFPSLADVGFLSFPVIAALALLLFPRQANGLVSRVRAAFDGLVIAASVLFVSWSLVLGPLAQAGGPTHLARVTGLAYPVLDVVMVCLVFVLGLRRPAGARSSWLLLGGGLAVLALTDSVYVYLTLEGQVALTGTPLGVGWQGAFLLIALAAVMPPCAPTVSVRRHFTVTQELLPYVPFLAVIVELTRRDLSSEPFLVVNIVVLLALLAVRQVLIVVEKVALADDLEGQVVRRTAELSGLASIVESSDEAIIGKTTDGIVTSWNSGAERLYGYCAAEAVGRSVDLLVPTSGRQPSRAT